MEGSDGGTRASRADQGVRPTERSLTLPAVDMLDQLPGALRIGVFQINSFNSLQGSGQTGQIPILGDEHVVYHA